MLINCLLNKKNRGVFFFCFLQLAVLILLSSCKKCTTCKISNDGSGYEKTFPEYCASKQDVDRFKEDVAKEAAANFSKHSCNDK